MDDRGQPGRRPARGSATSRSPASSKLPSAAGASCRRAASASSPRSRPSLVAGIAIAWPFVVRDRNAGRARARARSPPSTRPRVPARAARGPAPPPRRAHPRPARPHPRRRRPPGLRGRRRSSPPSSRPRSRATCAPASPPASSRGHVRETALRPGQGAQPARVPTSTASRSPGEASGYRFSARAQLPAGTLAWCKENPTAAPPDQLRAVGTDLARVPLGQLRLGLGQVLGRVDAAHQRGRQRHPHRLERLDGARRAARPAARRAAASSAAGAYSPRSGWRTPSAVATTAGELPGRAQQGAGRRRRSRTACRRRRPAPARRRGQRVHDARQRVTRLVRLVPALGAGQVGQLRVGLADHGHALADGAQRLGRVGGERPPGERRSRLRAGSEPAARTRPRATHRSPAGRLARR